MCKCIGMEENETCIHNAHINVAKQLKARFMCRRAHNVDVQHDDWDTPVASGVAARLCVLVAWGMACMTRTYNCP